MGSNSKGAGRESERAGDRLSVPKRLKVRRVYSKSVILADRCGRAKTEYYEFYLTEIVYLPMLLKFLRPNTMSSRCAGGQAK